MQELVFAGDSLIEYYDWAARFPRHWVHNQGWAGETVQGLLGRVELIIRQCRAPNFIFIMSGTNNIGLEETDFIGSYRQIIEKFHRDFPAATICAHSLPPILIPWLDPELVNRTNRELRAVAAER
ncbi:MAG: GDSL-type esterase/lipase family protein [Desulfurivibrio sp.]|nr:GDSL-type esterase/lipase family protein [Desulfurivibrio sp.]